MIIVLAKLRDFELKIKFYYVLVVDSLRKNKIDFKNLASEENFWILTRK